MPDTVVGPRDTNMNETYSQKQVLIWFPSNETSHNSHSLNPTPSQVTI